jgi:Skp family chaperone for outer membrane proteins
MTKLALRSIVFPIAIAVIFAQSSGIQDPAQDKGTLPAPQNDSSKCLKVAVIDSQKAFDRSNEGQKLSATLNKISKKKVEEEIQRIRAEMIEVVQRIAKEDGYNLVLDLSTSGVICFSVPVDDITDKLIERYNSLIR